MEFNQDMESTAAIIISSPLFVLGVIILFIYMSYFYMKRN